MDASTAPGPASVEPRRGRRAAAPSLLVDLLEAAYRTPFWSSSQMIVRNLAGDLAPGARFGGVFGFDGAHGFGLFEAAVARCVSAQQLIGAEFCWVSLAGRALMAAFEAHRRRDPLGRGPAMLVMLSRPTLGWSRSGLLIAGRDCPVAPGGPVHGLLRRDTAEEPKPFAASVVRRLVDPASGAPALALKFVGLPPATQALLDAAARLRAAA